MQQMALWRTKQRAIYNKEECALASAGCLLCSSGEPAGNDAEPRRLVPMGKQRCQAACEPCECLFLSNKSRNAAGRRSSSLSCSQDSANTSACCSSPSLRLSQQASTSVIRQSSADLPASILCLPPSSAFPSSTCS